MPPANPKNYPTNAAAGDLGLPAAGFVDPMAAEDEEQKKRRLLQQQRERMGQDGASVYGEAAMSLFGGVA